MVMDEAIGWRERLISVGCKGNALESRRRQRIQAWTCPMMKMIPGAVAPLLLACKIYVYD
jgi:hypothetical protein